MRNPKIKHHSAGGVVINGRGQVVLVSQFGKSWSLPKGHVEEGEEVLETAKREIYEETGLTQLDFVEELGSYVRPIMIGPNKVNPNILKKLTFFLFKTSQEKLLPVDPHNPQAVWVEAEKALDLLHHQKDKEFLESVKGKI